MLHLRSIIILSVLMFALLMTTASAGSGGKPTPNCDPCLAKMKKCAQTCKNAYTDPTAYAACAQIACACDVGKDKFCRESCDIGGSDPWCYFD